MSARESLCPFPDPVVTIAPCDQSGCPLDRHSRCVRNGCPGNRPEWMGPRPGLYDVDGHGEVIRTDVLPMEIQTEDFDVGWMPRHWGGRGKAAQWYASEMGCEFIEVRVTVQWLRAIDEYEDGQLVRTWTDGPLWHACKETDDGAHAFWRCEIR